MTPSQLRAFHAVASTGSFTAAAKRLGISQPSLTTQVRDLEELYGVELFYRHGRGVELTGVGRQFLDFAQRIVTNQQEAVEFLRDAGQLQTGTLRVGALGAIGLTGLLRAFRSAYPGLDVFITPGNSKELLDGLRQYRFDVALVGQIGDLTGLYVTCHTRPEIVIIVSREHRWANRESIGMSELEGEPLIYREDGSNAQRALQHAADQAGVKLLRALTYASREGQMACVAAGLGIGSIPDDQYVDHPMLRKLRIHDAQVYVHSYLACLAERKDSRVIHAFMSLGERIMEMADSPGKGSSVTNLTRASNTSSH